MAEIKLTKTDLRDQQHRLAQLEKYLPTLQLKKAMLQAEVNDARLEIIQLQEKYRKEHEKVEHFAALLSDELASDPKELAVVEQVQKNYENIAGVEVPYFEGVIFKAYPYNMFATPPWLDSAIAKLRELVIADQKINVVKEKKTALERELKEVSIRVNLFEKILIPRAKANIKRIKVFLGDQELAAVSMAKAAKNKIMKGREAKRTIGLISSKFPPGERRKIAWIATRE